MKRFHVHVAVRDLSESIRFYSSLFGTPPSLERADYAKWMLDDPRVNFAISNRLEKTGLNHLGFQVDSSAELVDMKDQLVAADGSMTEESGKACCYARSDKYWVKDPAGIAWETFHTLRAAPVYEDTDTQAGGESACCVPLVQTEQSSACCVEHNPEPQVQRSCCS
jgi:catechol 2,3-dioxygenase-like lactoylglutathione lyase family enzyme